MAIDDEWAGSEQSGLVGKMAGRYRIVSEVATDGRRTLYEAENGDGERVTIGVVRADGTPATERLRNGEKLRSLKQPGLVSVLDVGKLDSGDLYVANERAVGASLRTMITGTLLEQRRALAIIRQVLEALAAVHAAGAIHGDIKPESINVAVEVAVDGRVDRVKLTDFGVATLAGSAKSGDGRYSAPETALGKVDGRADLYATGAVLFELLTGHPPFFADGAEALRRLHAYGPLQTLAQRAPSMTFLPALEDVVAKALAKKREARYQTADEMIEAIDRAIDAVEAAAPPPPEPEGGRRRKPNDSLLVLAKDLMPAAQATNDVVIPVNVDRKVPELPMSMRAKKRARSVLSRGRDLAANVDAKLGLRARFDKLTRRQKQIVVGAAALLVLIVIIVIAMPSGSKPSHDVVTRAKALTDHGKAKEAVVLLTQEVSVRPENVRAQAALGATELSLGHEREALTAYQDGIAVSSALAADPDVVAALTEIAGSTDAKIAIDALELIALRSGVQGDKVITTVAASAADAEVRHRAYALAEQRGIADRVDRVASWMLDLEQAKSCDGRRAAINKLAGAADQRALPALHKAKEQKCVEREANAAIQRLSATKAH